MNCVLINAAFDIVGYRCPLLCMQVPLANLAEGLGLFKGLDALLPAKERARGLPLSLTLCAFPFRARSASTTWRKCAGTPSWSTFWAVKYWRRLRPTIFFGVSVTTAWMGWPRCAAGSCGQCKNQIKELKWDFELRVLPSGDFFVNAGYLHIMT